MKIIWSPLALERVREQARHIEHDNPTAAREWVVKIFDAVENIAAFPLGGRVVPEVENENIRELIFEGYRIIYRLEADGIEVVTVRHGRRDSPIEEIDKS